MLLHLGQLLHLGLQHTSQSSWLLLTKYIWALVSVWFIISSKPCGWYTALILWSVPHNLNSSSLTLLTNSWPWSDITIFASLYLVIRLYRKSATPRGPIYIYLSEQVKFKPRLNLTQASIKKVSISNNFATFCKKKKKKFWLRQNCFKILIFVTGYTQGKLWNWTFIRKIILRAYSETSVFNYCPW